MRTRDGAGRVSAVTVKAAVALAAMLAVGSAGAAGLRDAADGWVLTAEDLAGAGQADVACTGAWLRSAGGRLYGMPELPVGALAAGWTGWRWHGAVSWQRTGAGLLVEDLGRLGLAWGRRWRFGAVLSGRRLVLGDRPGAPEWRSALYAALRLQPGDGLQARMEVWAPWGGEDLPREGRTRRLRVAVAGADWAVAAALDTSADAVPALGCEALLWFGSGAGGGGLALGARADAGAPALGPVVVWRRGAVFLRTSHVAHARLGLTHRFELGWGLRGGRLW